MIFIFKIVYLPQNNSQKTFQIFFLLHVGKKKTEVIEIKGLNGKFTRLNPLTYIQGNKNGDQADTKEKSIRCLEDRRNLMSFSKKFGKENNPANYVSFF